MNDIKAPRLTARLFTTDRTSVEVPDVAAPPPATEGKIKVSITYPSGEQSKTVHRVALINQDTGAIARKSVVPVTVSAGDTLTVEFTGDDVISEGLLTPVRRHPAEVTADRLTEDAIRYADKLDGHEKDAFGTVINALQQIANGER